MLNEHTVTEGKTKTRYRLKAVGTTNTYAYCRIAARDALAQAESAKSGAMYFCMMAGVFSAFTVEAFLNHLGRLKVRDWDTLERNKGPREKLEFLAASQNWQLPLGKRPFQTLRQMVFLRNSLAHGKTETVVKQLVMSRPPKEGDRWPEADWKKLCTVAVAKKMVEDAEAIVNDLSRRSGSPRDPLASLGHARSGVEEIADN